MASSNTLLRNIFGYKVFKNEEDFQKWQCTETKDIVQMTPVMETISLNHTQSTESIIDSDGSYGYCIFVVYIIKQIHVS